MICGARNRLEQIAQKLGAVIEVLAPGYDCPLAKFGKSIKAVLSSGSNQSKQPKAAEASSYALSCIDPGTTSEWE